ncbi:MAG TPA: hemerythrin domain-containing protein [Chitinophagaceae bacterium]|nr:hemerythrin domain-containing protein [Chitinophagaceae bacterium]
MKEQGPIKRHPAIVSFSKDHHFGLLLVWKIRQGLNKAVDPERISNYVLYFLKEDLGKHFKEEEQILFSRLPDNDPLRTQAEAAHQSIYELITTIDENKNNTSLLSQIADELESHIRFEERELFNHLQINIPGHELEKIAERFSADNKVIDDKWEDAFWEHGRKTKRFKNAGSAKRAETNLTGIEDQLNLFDQYFEL